MNVSGWNARSISGIPMIPAIKESMIVPANFQCKLGLPSGLTKIYFKIMKASGCSF